MNGTLLVALRRPVTRRGLMLFALAAFALQAAIPVGFMLGVVEGRTSYVMCPAGGPMPATMSQVTGHHMDASQMAGMSHAMGVARHAAMAHRHAGAADHAACPFALASGAALLASQPAQAEPYFVILQARVAPAPASIPAAAPLRHRAARGPPVLC